MEIPTYQSRNPGPGGSGLEPANPAIVGGGAITQGLNNVASAFGALAPYERRQQQADQIAQASEITGQIQGSLAAKKRELLARQAQEPVDPREVEKDFLAHLDDLTTATINDENVRAMPAVHKYVAQQLNTIGQHARQSMSAWTEPTWANWNELRTLTNVENFSKLAAEARTRGDQDAVAYNHKQIDIALMGAVATNSMPAVKADEVRQRSNTMILNQSARSIAGSESQALWDATIAGETKKFWADHGMNESEFSLDLQDKVNQIRDSSHTQLAANAMRTETELHNQDEALKTAYSNEVMSLHLDRTDDTGKVQRGQSPRSVINMLNTSEARNRLGSKFHTVLTYYESLDHAERAGIPPRQEDVAALYLRIYKGELNTPEKVVRAATTMHFDTPSMNNAVAQFHTTENKLDDAAKTIIGQGEKIITETFDFPSSQAIDQLQAKTHMRDAKLAYYLMVEHAQRTMSPQELASFDFIGRAQALADAKAEQMQSGIIKILENSKPLVKETDALAMAKTGEISKHQLDSILQEHANYKRMEVFMANRKKRLAELDAADKKKRQ